MEIQIKFLNIKEEIKLIKSRIYKNPSNFVAVKNIIAFENYIVLIYENSNSHIELCSFERTKIDENFISNFKIKANSFIFSFK